MWVVIVSPIPLTASAALICFICARPISELLPQSLVGDVEIDFDGHLNIQGIKGYFDSISDLHGYAYISFHGKKQRWLLWRDSCDDVTYRQLLVRLKQKQEH